MHGFDEFFGYLYHLDAMSDPYWFDYPQDWIDKYGPRDLVHCYATDTDDPTVMPRWGKVGKQRIIDEGPLAPFPNMTADHQNWQKGRAAKYDMETFDEVLVDNSKRFMDQAKQAGKPFFIWHNTTRMHVFTYLGPKYQAMMNYESNYGLEEGGMAQMDNNIGDLLKHLDEIGEANNTIVIFTTDNGAEVFTWPDGGMTPFRATKGTVFEGGFRVPCIARWPGKIKPGTVENGLFSGLDWLPTLAAAAGNPNITEQLLKGVQLGDRTYKNHLDGYNQLDLLTGKGPSARHELFYFGGPHLGALRIDDFKFQFYQQPWGWPGEKTNDRHADNRQHPPGPIRADAFDSRRIDEQHGRWVYERLLCPRILALRPGAATCGCVGADGHRVSADAGARLVQPRGRETAGRRGDQGARGAVADMMIAGRGTKNVPPPGDPAQDGMEVLISARGSGRQR